MEKYYSSVLTVSGLLCYFKVLCIKNPSSKFYIINDGTDFERAIFFDEVKKKFNGFNITEFSPFYDESLNGIYIQNKDTFILSNSSFSKVSPLSLGLCEKEISLSGHRAITKGEKEKILKCVLSEKEYYKKAISFLNFANVCKENRNTLFADYLSDDRTVNAISRILRKIPLGIKRGKPNVRFLSAATPLGIHTFWDTVFEKYETVIELEDKTSFSSAIIMGVIRDQLISATEEFILIPDFFHKTIPQMLLIPQTGIAIIRTDDNHVLPFSPTNRINTEKFISTPKSIKEKGALLKEAENSYIENAISCIYEGRDERQKMNKTLMPYCNIENAKSIAEKTYKEIMA